MQTLSTVSPDEILQEACARNQPLEIFYTNEKDEDRQAKSRFIAIEPKRVLIERPTVGARDAEIPSETIVTVHFSISGQRWKFQSRVTGQRLFQLNAQNKVVVVQLHLPNKILPNQRRRDFRISLASYSLRVFLFSIDEKLPKNLRMILRGSDDSKPDSEQGSQSNKVEGKDETRSQPDGVDPPAKKDTAPVAQTRMANLSSGGIALMLATVPDDVSSPASPVAIRDRFWAVFSLPGDEEIFRFPIEVHHVKRNDQTETTVIGCKFLIEDNSFDVRTSVRRIARFIALEQRRQLRKGADLK